MLRKLILKEEAGKELILPVTPASWQGEAGRKASSLTMHTVGAVNLPGSRVLLDEELDCLLPAKEYSFNTPGAVTDPWHYLRQLIRWSDEGTVLRFIVSGTEVNEAVILDPIRYREQDGTNDIYCTIPLRGYRTLAAETTETSTTGNNARAVSSTTVTQATYTVVAGDTLSAIARKFYGDASLYGKLAAANGIKNANLIYPGQVLKIPDVAQLPAADVASSGAVEATKQSQAKSVRLGIAFTGSKAYYGTATVQITDPDTGEKTLVSITNSSSGITMKTKSEVEIRWISKGYPSDFYLIGAKQYANRSYFSAFTIEKDITFTIHWTGADL